VSLLISVLIFENLRVDARLLVFLALARGVSMFGPVAGVRGLQQRCFDLSEDLQDGLKDELG